MMQKSFLISKMMSNILTNKSNIKSKFMFLRDNYHMILWHTFKVHQLKTIQSFIFLNKILYKIESFISYYHFLIFKRLKIFYFFDQYIFKLPKCC